MAVKRRTESSMPQLETVKGENASEGTYYVCKKFKELYIDGGYTQDDSKEKCCEDCRKLLENGYKFRYVIISSYISKLASAKTFSRKSLQNAKKAFECLLLYGLNLCRYPEQKEYKLIKKYTAYFTCNIEDNLSPSPEIADTILEGMGYKLADSKDEFGLSRVSQVIFEVCFELFLGQMELDRIVSVLDFANTSFGLSDAETISIWEEYVLSEKTVWCQKDCEQVIKEKFYQSERHSRKPTQKNSNALKNRGRVSDMSNAITHSGPKSLSDMSQQKKRTHKRSNSDENNDWMYDNRQPPQYSSKSKGDFPQGEALVDSSAEHMYHQQVKGPERFEQKLAPVYYYEKGSTNNNESSLTHSEGLVHDRFSGETIFMPPSSPSSLPYSLDLHSSSGKPDDASPMDNVDVRKQDLEYNANDSVNSAKVSRRRSNSMTQYPHRIYDSEKIDSQASGMLPPGFRVKKGHQLPGGYKSSVVSTDANVRRHDISHSNVAIDFEIPKDSGLKPLPSNGEQNADNTSTRMRSSHFRRHAPEIYQKERSENATGHDIPQDERTNNIKPRDSTVGPLTSSGEQDADTITRMRSNPLPRTGPSIYQAHLYENLPIHDVPQTVGPLTSNGEQDGDTSTRARSNPLPRTGPSIYQAHLYENLPIHDVLQDKRTNDISKQRDSTAGTLTSNREHDASNSSTHMRSNPLQRDVPDIYQNPRYDSPASYSREAQREYQYSGKTNIRSKSEPVGATLQGVLWNRRQNDGYDVKSSRDTIVQSVIHNSKYDIGSIPAVSREEHFRPINNEQADSSQQQYIHEMLPAHPVGQHIQQHTPRCLEPSQRSNAFSGNDSSQSEQQQRKNVKETRASSFEERRNFGTNLPAIYGEPSMADK